MFEFHIEFLGLVLLMLLLLILERARGTRKDMMLVVLVSIAILTVKEDLALVLGAVGLWFLVFRKRQRTEGLTMFTIGAAGAVVVYLYVMPHFSGGELSHFDRYSDLGSTPGEVARVLFTRPDIVLANLVTPPEKVVYLLGLLASFLFLPLFAPVLLLAAIAPLFFN